MTRTSRWRPPRVRVSRDTILFVVGLAGLIFVTLKGGPERPTLIIAFVGMMGLPLFIGADEKRRKKDNDDDPPAGGA